MDRVIIQQEKEGNKMYKFIKERREGYSINEEDIKTVEKCWNIEIPTILKQFYINYNGAKINLCKFFVDDFKYEISEIIPLKYGKCCLEEVIRNDRQDDIIPSNMIPIANDRGGDYYYWDMSSGRVYLFYCDDIENPIYICKSIEEMFEIMNKSCI